MVRGSGVKSNRVTIMIDIDLDKKLRMRQAKMIMTTTNSVSFSAVLNDVLRKALK